ncbi:MAG: metal-dependent hydrolase [Planctomycetaceae bacterium]|nr:metal-dependent hydrolase [Planctomycetaceae bacterium]
MGNYRQHATLSSVTGTVCAGLAWWPCGFPVNTCLVAGGLCGIGGLLPDIDSSTSRSFKDYMWITGCVVSTLVAARLNTLGINGETVAVISVGTFLLIRFGLASLMKKFTIHRGIIHSIPATILSGELIFLLSAGTLEQRILKAVGFSLGFLSHLILDEICSFKQVNGKLQTKKSLGTALKFFDFSHLGAAFVCYSVLASLTWLSLNSPDMLTTQLSRHLDRFVGISLQGAEKLNQASNQAQKQLTDASGVELWKNHLPNPNAKAAESQAGNIEEPLNIITTAENNPPLTVMKPRESIEMPETETSNRERYSGMFHRNREKRPSEDTQNTPFDASSVSHPSEGIASSPSEPPPNFRYSGRKIPVIPTSPIQYR